MHRKIALSTLVSILLTIFAFGASRQIGKPKLKSIIRQIDHILIQTRNPKELFDFFAETLQLPVAWPLTDYKSFASGGVAAGNVNIEVLCFADQKKPSSTGRSQAHFIGLALEPFGLADCLSELQARGISYDVPKPYVSKLPNGTEGTLWTNVVLSQFSKPDLSIFLCEYSTAFLHAEIRRNQLGGQLALRKGGPLGIKSVNEIVIGTRDLTKDRSDWQRLAAPRVNPSAMSLRIGNGPAIHLVPASIDRIQRIILKVDSLKSAKHYLAWKQLLGAVSANEISIDPLKLQGLSLRLVER